MGMWTPPEPANSFDAYHGFLLHEQGCRKTSLDRRVERERIALDNQRGRTMMDELLQDLEKFCTAAQGPPGDEGGTRQAAAALDAAAD
eukprot:10148542-Lingulodinium_polyedra.AAC.1